jgi:hypothetical protein
MKRTIRFRVAFGLALGGLLAAPPAAAQPVPAQTLASALADGKPWGFRVPDGKTGTFIFHKDGTGQMTSGSFNLKIKWRVDGERFCIAMGLLLGTKCLSANHIRGGYQTLESGKNAFTFTRQDAAAR